MGLSMDETMAALVQLDNTFGSAQQGGTFLNRMLLDMTAKAEQAGLELYNVDGSMRTLDEIMGAALVRHIRSVLRILSLGAGRSDDVHKLLDLLLNLIRSGRNLLHRSALLLSRSRNLLRRRRVLLGRSCDLVYG